VDTRNGKEGRSGFSRTEEHGETDWADGRRQVIRRGSECCSTGAGKMPHQSTAVWHRMTRKRGDALL